MDENSYGQLMNEKSEKITGGGYEEKPYDGIDYSNVYDEVYRHQAEHDNLYDEDNLEREETADFGERIDALKRSRLQKE